MYEVTPKVASEVDEDFRLVDESSAFIFEVSLLGFFLVIGLQLMHALGGVHIREQQVLNWLHEEWNGLERSALDEFKERVAVCADGSQVEGDLAGVAAGILAMVVDLIENVLVGLWDLVVLVDHVLEVRNLLRVIPSLHLRRLHLSDHLSLPVILFYYYKPPTS